METTLYFKDDTSDKVYHAEIAPSGDLFVVNFAYGRRGATLTTGTKTQTPVPLAQAQKIYDKLVAEKMAKGYTPGEDGTPYTSEGAGEKSGILPQLLNEIDEDKIGWMLHDPGWIAQQKFDGRRMMVRKNDKVEAVNRKGLIIGAPQPVIDQIATLPGEFILDGEIVGDVYYVFDMLHLNPYESPTYGDRLISLSLLEDLPNVKKVYTAHTTKEKKALLDRLVEQGAEGIVFKHLDSYFKHGRPNSGGDMLKYKFYKSLSAVVRQINDKRSVGLELWDRDRREYKYIGNVTIPPNKDIPAVGTMVEVRYLYATEAGILYQPVYIGPRDDIDDCLTSQLQFKGVEDDA